MNSKETTTMKKVIWRYEYEMYVPFCPYCNEFAYEENKCVFCNKEYEMTEYPESPIVVEYKNLKATQTGLGLWIERNGILLSHSSLSRKLTEEEILKMLRKQYENR